MDFLLELLAIVFIVFLAAASPGPDFVISVRNSVLHSRKAGIMTAFGIGAGNLIHVTYCIMGIAALIASSVTLFNIIKYVGAAYLIYIGYKALRSKGYDNERVIADNEKASEDKRVDIGAFKAFKNGLWTNLLNPKATMFWFALFTQIIEPGTLLIEKAIMGSVSCFVVTIWFCGVAVILNQRTIRRAFMSMAAWIDRVCGTALIALGIKLALSKSA